MTPQPIPFTLDGRPLTAAPGETLWAAAHRHGITIPHLCHTPGVEGLEPAGNCRACVVEIEGERVLAASCCRRVEPGMQAHAANDRARTAQRLVLELLTAAAPSSLAAPPVGGPSGPTALGEPTHPIGAEAPPSMCRPLSTPAVLLS